MGRHEDKAGAMTNVPRPGVLNGSVFRSMTLDGITRLYETFRREVSEDKLLLLRQRSLSYLDLLGHIFHG